MPKELLNEAGVGEGDIIKVSLAIPKPTRDSSLASIAAIDRKSKPFAREKRERF
jgi:hypothetical protein